MRARDRIRSRRLICQRRLRRLSGMIARAAVLFPALHRRGADLRSDRNKRHADAISPRSYLVDQVFRTRVELRALLWLCCARWADRANVKAGPMSMQVQE